MAMASSYDKHPASYHLSLTIIVFEILPKQCYFKEGKTENINN